ncbi:signal recognition particle protein [Inmirania thermothiophila]|uniref:Signal recognition particle protein n=1 Tax=Inmirania thermothiophila TaxID=1750597 RepID=A0A3N1Y8H7_9GAMM|nr:signal recognition particle protein [Inmirania thermothiophila]ROR35106.1 signal recognition particle subunit FFH/SRP54 (srp54) [Inmirania thermothiophila]
MFDNLTQRLTRTLDRLRGQGRLTEDNIRDTLREVRMALLEADVALPVVRAFIERVRERALGQEVTRSLTPGQALVKIVHDELVAVMGGAAEGLRLAVEPPAVILLAGLQGAGKTTTAAKLARLLRERERRSVMLASCDVYRPAAIDQLRTLAAELGVPFHEPGGTRDAVAIAREALAEARRRVADVLVVDTAGRLHVDEAMMAEVQALHAALNPAETLFVVDAMSGQDAANAARAFGAALPLTGVILTKADGDARGGAALSVRHITGRPVKFLGVGERSDALEPFDPARMASRILGMGDVLSLVEEVQRKVDRDKAEKLARKVRKGEGFDLEDFRDQLEQMSRMGGVAALLDKLPGAASLPEGVRAQMDDRELRRVIAIINSMTPRERRRPDIINGSRKRRIAAGSGTRVQDVNRLLKQFHQAQKLMKRMRRKGGMRNLLRGLGPGLPPL